jgi:hypothetical protein
MAPEAFSTEATKRSFEIVSLVLVSVALRAANAFAMHINTAERRNILPAKLDSLVAKGHGQVSKGIYVVATVRTAC